MKYLSLILLFTLFANSDIENTLNPKEITLTKVEIKNKKTIDAEKKLQSILQNIKKYKKNKNIQIKKLEGKIQVLKQDLKKQQNRKDRKIKRLEKDLLLTKRKLIKKQNEIVKLQTNIKIEVNDVVEVANKLVPIVTPKKWIKIIVENDSNIYDLALKYYGDSQEYRKIYTANKNIIKSNYQINNGMSLIIPITETFQEQPIMLNTN